MLDSVVEFITQAASSTAFIFCFCNLIIVIILVDLKPSLSFDQKREVSHPTNTGKQGTNSKCLVNKSTPTQQAGEVSHAHEEEAVHKIETEGNDDSCCNEEEEEEEEEEGKDDELRRRVEEFIEKVNKGWKAEYLNTSSLL